MNRKTLYWYDFETFGTNPRRDRACQFAGLRTDEDLNPIGDPLVLHCKPALDVLPDPEACLVTGIGPMQAWERGVTEAEFCARIAAELSEPGTCSAGYNTLRFDDEFTRHLLYRCFHDPYEREWKNGNSRWDIIDLVRMTHALRPAGIEWPTGDDGLPSFRLEHLTRANGISHEGAHDALADVLATIALARLVRDKQPRLYEWYYQHRFKAKVQPFLDVRKAQPVVHVSSMYPARQGCMAVVLPLAKHPGNPNGVIVYDLSRDPREWLGLDTEAIQHRLFTKTDVLQAEGLERIGLKTVHANKCPALAPLSVLDDVAKARWGIDLERCERHREILQSEPGLVAKIQGIFSSRFEGGEASTDPDEMLYGGGFFSDADRVRMTELRGLSPTALADHQPDFDDDRLPEMLFRYRSRNYPDSLNAGEKARWFEHCRALLLESRGGNGSRLEAVRARTAALLENASGRDREVLEDLRSWMDGVCGTLGI